MTTDRTDKEIQPKTITAQETYSPVIVTDTVGALFLGVISVILMAVVGGLMVRNRKLEDQLRELAK